MPSDQGEDASDLFSGVCYLQHLRTVANTNHTLQLTPTPKHIQAVSFQ